MNNIEKIFDRSADAAVFARNYIQYLTQLLEKLDCESVARVVTELEEARSLHRTIFVVGNGGSAATASHMANDLAMDVLKKSGVEHPFRVMSLTDNVSLMTAIANDEGYEKLFVNKLRIYYRPGDVLIAISASGNSPNVVAAAEWVKSRGGRVIGFVGFDGGSLKKLCDISVCVETPHGEYGPVEDIHMVLDHLIANWLQYKMRALRPLQVSDTTEGRGAR
jgi:D-sedoheptulose 7-phosphate isomerase